MARLDGRPTPHQSDVLPQIPLKWLLEMALLHGLAFRKDVVVDGDGLEAAIADSFASFAYGAYRVAKLGRRYQRLVGTRPVEREGRITTTINETIDASVFARWRHDLAYRPGNLVDWARRHGVDAGSIRGSVSVDQPGVVLQDPPVPVVPDATIPSPAPPPVA